MRVSQEDETWRNTGIRDTETQWQTGWDRTEVLPRILLWSHIPLRTSSGWRVRAGRPRGWPGGADPSDRAHLLPRVSGGSVCVWSAWSAWSVWSERGCETAPGCWCHWPPSESRLKKKRERQKAYHAFKLKNKYFYKEKKNRLSYTVFYSVITM